MLHCANFLFCTPWYTGIIWLDNISNNGFSTAFWYTWTMLMQYQLIRLWRKIMYLLKIISLLLLQQLKYNHTSSSEVRSWPETSPILQRCCLTGWDTLALCVLCKIRASAVPCAYFWGWKRRWYFSSLPVLSLQGEGQTPLHVAAWEGDELMLKFFYQYKANPNITDKVLHSILMN